MRNIALIAHDGRKKDIIKWVQNNKEKLEDFKLFGTGTTGSLVTEKTGMKVESFRSGPLGGDLQIGTEIINGKIDLLIFFWDPLEAQPHDPDVKALLRIAVLENIPTACNKSTADFLINSKLFDTDYRREKIDYSTRIVRKIELE